MQPVRASGGRDQMLAVFSLAGGVGKTSLVATLGRALSAQGEKVVLADTTAQGLLPIYLALGRFIRRIAKLSVAGGEYR